MKTIYKYELEPVEVNEIEMPKVSKILSAKIDQKTGNPCIWVFVDTESEKVTRKFSVIGTGQRVNWDSGYLSEFIDTVQMHDGMLVFHIFEIWKEEVSLRDSKPIRILNN